VHIYRFITLDTIDRTLYGERSGRTSADIDADLAACPRFAISKEQIAVSQKIKEDRLKQRDEKKDEDAKPKGKGKVRPGKRFSLLPLRWYRLRQSRARKPRASARQRATSLRCVGWHVSTSALTRLQSEEDVKPARKTIRKAAQGKVAVVEIDEVCAAVDGRSVELSSCIERRGGARSQAGQAAAKVEAGGSQGQGQSADRRC
jgi:hypothetical protein